MGKGKAGWMWPEDVAVALGVTVRTVRKMLMEARHRHEDGTTRPRDLPLPHDYQLRDIWNGHHMVKTRSPRWRSRVISEFAEARPGRGGPGQSRAPRRKQEPTREGEHE